MIPLMIKMKNSMLFIGHRIHMKPFSSLQITLLNGKLYQHKIFGKPDKIYNQRRI